MSGTDLEVERVKVPLQRPVQGFRVDTSWDVNGLRHFLDTLLNVRRVLRCYQECLRTRRGL